MKPFKMSQRFERLNTGIAARRERASRALADYTSAPFALHAGDQASASVVSVGSLEILISYELPVAYRHGDIAVAVELGEYSKTTDRSIREFTPNYGRYVSEGEFRERLRTLLLA